MNIPIGLRSAFVLSSVFLIFSCVGEVGVIRTGEPAPSHPRGGDPGGDHSSMGGDPSHNTGGTPGNTPACDGNIVPVDPSMSIQSAIDSAMPGDVVMLAPGTYYQSVVIKNSGTESSPISLCAATPGTVTITGATPPEFVLTFTQVSGDLCSATVPWTVRWVVADGRNLMGYDDRSGLENFTIEGHDTGRTENGPPEGFTWDSATNTLYVRLINGQNPNTAQIEIHRDFDAIAEFPRSNSAFYGDPGYPKYGGNRGYPSDDTISTTQARGTNITVLGSHIVIAGLRLHLGPLGGVYVGSDSTTPTNVTIRDNYFTSNWRAILTGDSSRVTVEHNEISGYPAYQWVRWGSLNNDQWSVWNALYNSNLNTNPVHHFGTNFVLRNNIIYEGFDCLAPREMDTLDPASRSEYGYNVVHSCVDECIEFDTRKAINLRVHHNFLMNATAVLALSPVQGGGLMIDHNIAYVSPEYGLRSTVLFKFDKPWSTVGPTKGVTIAHNTLVHARTRLYWTGEDHTYADDIAENNIMHTRFESGWVHPDFTISAYNMHSGPNIENRLNANHMSHLIHEENPGFVSAPPMGAGVSNGGSFDEVPVVPFQSSAPTSDAPKIDFALDPSGASVDAGNPDPALDSAYHHTRSGSAPDLGALELGGTWDFFAGPRWAIESNKPWRPPLPPTLEPQWVGDY